MADPLAGEVELPAVGGVPKKAIAGIAVAAVAFVAWRYYVARQDGGTDGETVDPGMEDPGTLPAVQGAVKDGNLYGNGDAVQPSVDQYGFTGTTNAQWTQYASTQLSQSDTWSYTDILTALGNFLAGKPLTTLQQSIVNAAIGVTGSPPVGSHVVVPGGNTPITIAPSGLKASNVTTSAVTLNFGAVAGAAGYRAYRGAGSNVGSAVGNTIIVSGLEPNTSYTFTVKAITAAGTAGPASNAVTVKTKGVTLRVPAKPRVSAVQKTSAHLATNAVPNADGYNWYINGTAHGHSDAPSYTVTGLSAGRSYTASVAADTSTGAPTKASGTTAFKTKK
jgi:hypothetical protein